MKNHIIVKLQQYFTTMKIPTFRLFDFEVLNRKDETDFEYYEGDRRKFIIKMFGMDEKGKTYCIFR